MHAQIRYKATEKRIRVETVNLAYSSKTCHCRRKQGYRPKRATFDCSNSEGRVSEYQTDVNAALDIADRYLSEESHSREHTDGMTRPRKGDVRSSYKTVKPMLPRRRRLETYASWKP